MIPVSKLMNALSADVVVALADDNQDNVADPGVLEAAIAAAEEQVRAGLHRGGMDATTELTPLLEDLVITLAVERLFERRRELIPEPWSGRAKRARLILEEIAAGRHPIRNVARDPGRIASPSEESQPLHRLNTLNDY